MLIVLDGVGSLRKRPAPRAVAEAIDATKDASGFRVVQFKVDPDRIHVLVEAEDGAALSRGMQGLGIRLARAVNRALERSGKLWAGRYQSKTLRTPADVESALMTIEDGRAPVATATTPLLSRAFTRRA